MKCEICKAEYNEKLPSCPFCGAVNPNYSNNLSVSEPKNKCNKCGTELEPDDRFCGCCGALVESITHCVKCNNIIKPNDTFCTQCGYCVASNVQAAPYIPEASNRVSDTTHNMSSSELFSKPRMTAEILDDTPNVANYNSEPRKVLPSSEPTVATPDVIISPTEVSQPISINPVNIHQSTPEKINIPPENNFINTQSESSFSINEPLATPIENVNRAAPLPEIQTENPFHNAAVQAIPISTVAEQPEVLGMDPNVNIISEETPKPNNGKKVNTAQQTLTKSEELFNTPAVSEVTPTVSTTPFKKEPTKKKRSKAPLIILLIIIITLLIASALVFFDIIKLPASITNFFTKSEQNAVPGDDSNESSNNSKTKAEEPSNLSSGNESSPQQELQQDYSYVVESLTESTWDEVIGFDNNGLAFVKEGELWGVIDIKGEYLISPTFDSASSFFDGFAAVSQGEKFGYINTSGGTAIPLEYDSATAFSEGFAVVTKDGSSFFISSTGEQTKIESEGIVSLLNNGFSAVNSPVSGLFVNTSGQPASDSYDEVASFSEGFAAVRKESKWSYVDLDFNSPIEGTFDEAGPFENGFASVKDGTNAYLIDKVGNRVTPLVDEIWLPKDGISTVKKDSFYGFVPPGSSESLLIEPQFKNVYGFSMGMAPVSVNDGIWYYVDISNNPVFQDKYFDEAYMFIDALACVKNGSNYTMIDIAGNFAISEDWEKIGVFSQGMLPVYENGKWSFVSVKKSE